jgi:pseudouridine-5'-monophosphatase
MADTPGFFQNVTHIIFDVDGLLLDTETIYTKMMSIICGRYNTEFTWELKVKLMGKKHQESAKIFIESLGLPITVDDYTNQLTELIDIYFPCAEPLLGAERLVRHLHAHHIPMALATGSHMREFELKTARHKELFSLFSHTVCSSDDPEVKNGKPAPDCFLVAASRFPDKPLPKNVLVFEDAPNGVVGARAAGMQVIWIPDPRCLELDKSTMTDGVRPTLVLKSLLDFKPELFGLPAFD